MHYSGFGGEVLQIAMTVRHANRANVISFGEEQLQDHHPVLPYPFGIRFDFHPFRHFGDASRKEFITARHFGNAESASPDITQAIQMAKGWNFDSGVRCSLENRVTFLGAHRLAIDCQGFYSHKSL